MCVHVSCVEGCMYRSVPQIRPAFATLALVQNAGGAYMRDATISLMITPSLSGMKSLSVGGRDQAEGVAECEAERC